MNLQYESINCPRCEQELFRPYCDDCNVYISPTLVRWDFQNDIKSFSIYWNLKTHVCYFEPFYFELPGITYMNTIPHIDLPWLPFDVSLEQIKVYLVFS